jgi:hypothetical protein
MEDVINCESKALIKYHGPNLIDAAEAHLRYFMQGERNYIFKFQTERSYCLPTPLYC